MVSERALRILFLSLAVLHLAIGVWMFFFPRSFFETIGAFGAYNDHYERDTATFYFAFALGSWLAVSRRSWRIPVLAMTTLQYVIHTINHGIDVNDANNSWAGPFDLVTLGLGALQFAAVLALLHRGRRREGEQVKA